MDDDTSCKSLLITFARQGGSRCGKQDFHFRLISGRLFSIVLHLYNSLGVFYEVFDEEWLKYVAGEL